MRQLPLGVRLQDAAVFETYFAGPNEGAVAHLRSLSDGSGTGGAWLWGPAGSGKTHLSQAACRATDGAGRAAVYLPLEALAEHGAAPFGGWGDRDLVAVDDLDSIAGQPALERALFRLYNDLHEQGGRLLVTSVAPPSELPVELADLRSRLAAGATYRLRRLDDEACVEALRMRASHLGLDLPGKRHAS